jgi:WD40 repeat protein
VPQPKLKWVDLAFSPDGKRLALVSRSGYLAGVGSETEAVPGALELYEVGSKTTRRLCVGASCVAWSSVANLIAVGRHDGTIFLLDGETGVEVRSWQCGLRGVASIDWSPDGSRIIGGGDDRLVRIWHSGTGLELLSLSGCRGPVRRVRFDPHGRWIAASEPQAILVWDGGR